ncbi:helix-turn-helix transcriptional regulator [Streptomyces sp. NPDC059861]|uniref:helix-turn-helix transcriptional regulator n=1 Tax=Streptomyces sp. NPDC059861 TaxID=3346974 RepID=UPI0036595564
MSITRLHRGLQGLVTQGLDSSLFRHESAARITAAVGAEAYCFAEIDPESGLATNYATGNLDRSGAPLLHFNEFGQRDFLKLRSLADGPVPASSLSAATGGRLECSPRYRDLLCPLGLGDEIRAVAMTDGRVWGFLHLFRRQKQPAFDKDEIGSVAEVSQRLAVGIRNAVLTSSAPTKGHQEPALVMLDDSNRIVESTTLADKILADLRDPDEPDGQTPEIAVMMAVCARIRSSRPGPGNPDVPVAARVRARTAHWFSLHASTTTSDHGAGHVALILNPVEPPTSPEAWAARYGLSAGERDVVDRMLAGRSTAQTAAELMISPWTVQDRFTNVFAKTGVRSRRELTSLLRP